MKTLHPFITTIIFSITMLTISSSKVSAQQTERKVRIAKIEIYAAYLDEYRVAIAEHAKTAVRVEPGVLALQAVYDKAHPAQVTVFEVYAGEAAYQEHLKTPHFLKYKSGTLKMVKSLELIEVAPIAMEIKPELSETKKENHD
jgi:quinol monooxygenase YgiN